MQMVGLNLMIRKILFHRLRLFRNLSQELIFWEMFHIFRFWLSKKGLFGRFLAHSSVPPHQAGLRIWRRHACSQTSVVGSTTTPGQDPQPREFLQLFSSILSYLGKSSVIVLCSCFVKGPLLLTFTFARYIHCIGGWCLISM